MNNDQEQMINQHETIEENADREQRRTTRIGTILAAVVMVGALCTILCKIMMSFLNLWIEKGIWYRVYQVGIILAFTVSLLICFDIVLYVLIDLKRYNLLDSKHKKYDEISDKFYFRLIDDIKIYMILLAIFILLYIPFSIIYESEKGKIIQILIYFFGLVAVICVGIYSKIKNGQIAEVKKIKVSDILQRVFILLIASVICWCVGTFLNFNNIDTIKIDFSSEGAIIVDHESQEEYGGMDIEIDDMEGGQIYKESVEKGKLLLAKEDEYTSRESRDEITDKAASIKGEKLYWRYIFDLREIIHEPGKYYIKITVYQNEEQVLLINSVILEEKQYTYTLDNMEKEY